MAQGEMQQILPRGTVFVEVRDPGLRASLFPEEELELGAVCDKRRRDFTLGRDCARRALGKLGVEAQPIRRGPMREPLWPTGVCGSITHCEGLWAAAVAWKNDIFSLGIDVEPRRQLPAGVLEIVASRSEIQRIERASQGVPWELLLFSAKESVFKAWFPVKRTWLGFDEAEIEFLPRSNEFRAVLTPGGISQKDPPLEMRGRYHVDEGYAFTSALVLYASALGMLPD